MNEFVHHHSQENRCVVHDHQPLWYCYTARRFPPVRLNGDRSNNKSTDRGDVHEVRIIDNDFNTYQQVMDITMLALGITEEEAYAVAWEVDHEGSCVVAAGPYDEAEAIAGIIRTIGIEVQVNPVVMGHA